MKESSAKNNILKKIKQALATLAPVPFAQTAEHSNIFIALQNEKEVEFAENFTNLQGRFSFCGNMEELVTQLKILITAREWKNIFCSEDDLKSRLAANGFINDYTNNLAACHVSITSCEFLIARTGSIVLSSAAANGRTASVYAPVHICVACTHQLVADIKDALENIKEKQSGLPSSISFASGPSRTADIEKTLVTGVHGPKEVFCFLVEG